MLILIDAKRYLVLNLDVLMTISYNFFSLLTVVISSAYRYSHYCLNIVLEIEKQM